MWSLTISPQQKVCESGDEAVTNLDVDATSDSLICVFGSRLRD
jgi:hypothetical protein